MQTRGAFTKQGGSTGVATCNLLIFDISSNLQPSFRMPSHVNLIFLGSLFQVFESSTAIILWKQEHHFLTYFSSYWCIFELPSTYLSAPLYDKLACGGMSLSHAFSSVPIGSVPVGFTKPTGNNSIKTLVF